MSRTLQFSLRLTLLLAFTMSVYVVAYIPVANATHDTTFHEDADLLGWAWSPTVGWISISCENASESCGTSNYKVQIKTDKQLEGYAWSSNIGWIRFGGLGAPPNGGVYRGQARVSGEEGSWGLEGWLRACSVFASECSGSLRPNSERGDWTGWISLSGTSPDYAISMNNSGNFRGSSAAWGDIVVGWINFSDVLIDITSPSEVCANPKPASICSDATTLVSYDLFCGEINTNCAAVTGGTCDTSSGVAVCVTPSSIGSLTVAEFTAVPTWVRKNERVLFNWRVTGGEATCLAMGSDGNASDEVGINANDVQSAEITLNITTFRLQCDTRDGNGFQDLPGSDTVEVKLIPNVEES